MKEYTEDQLLMRAVEATYKTFLWAPDEHVFTVLTLWVAHTHLRRSISAGGEFLPYITPRLYFGSTMAGCGKSLALKLTAKMSHNGRLVSSATIPAMINMLNEGKASVFFDEIDRYFRRSGSGRDEMHNLLNAGYEREATMPCVLNHQVQDRNVHGPVALAGKNVAQFNREDFDTLRTRSIQVILDQKPVDAFVDRYDAERHNPRLKIIMERLKEWGVANGQAITSIFVDEIMPREIHNRAGDIWRILFQVAQHLGDDWPARIDAAARSFVLGERAPTESRAVVSPEAELRNTVSGLFEDGEDFLSTSEILLRIGRLPTRPAMFFEWTTTRSMEMGLSTGLEIFGITSSRHTYNGEQRMGYTWLAVKSPVAVDLADQQT